MCSSSSGWTVGPQRLYLKGQIICGNNSFSTFSVLSHQKAITHPLRAFKLEGLSLPDPISQYKRLLTYLARHYVWISLQSCTGENFDGSDLPLCQIITSPSPSIHSVSLLGISFSSFFFSLLITPVIFSIDCNGKSKSTIS